MEGKDRRWQILSIIKIIIRERDLAIRRHSEDIEGTVIAVAAVPAYEYANTRPGRFRFVNHTHAPITGATFRSIEADDGGMKNVNEIYDDLSCIFAKFV